MRDQYSICNRCHIKDRVKNNCNEGNSVYSTTLPSHRLTCAIYAVIYEFDPLNAPSGFSIKAFEEFYHKYLAPVLLKGQNMLIADSMLDDKE